MKSLLLTTLSLFCIMTTSFAQIAGTWMGVLEVQGTSLKIAFNFEEKNGELTGTMDSPDLGATGLPLTKVSLEGNKLQLSLSQAALSYSGTVQGDKIEGNLSQGGMEIPLTLTKGVIEKPGNPKLVSSEADLKKLMDAEQGSFKYKVEDYFKRPQSSSFQLSPDGKYLSYMERDQAGKRHVYTKNIITGNTIKAIEEKNELIKGYGWINENRLVYVMDQGGNENYQIFAIDLDGKNNINLTPFEGVQASILNTLKEQKDFMIISLNKDNPQIFEPYKINVKTGELVKLFENKDVNNPIAGFDFDKDGNLRGYSKMFEGTKTQYFYKVAGSNTYDLHLTTNWDDNFNILSFNYASKNPDEAYVLTNLNSDKTKIVLYDFKNKKIIKEIFSNPNYDVSDISLSRKRNWEIDYLGYEGEKYVIKPVSKTFEHIYEQLEKQFKGYEYHLVGKTDEEDKYLVMVSSDRLVGRYYIYDAKANAATLLFDLMPQLKEEDMAIVKPIQFKSRDGLTIHGYITLPKNYKKGDKIPVIVNPHGGPQGIRDSWGFNPEAQLFASRGYATLQVNFRISGGYGKEFLRAGFKQIGRKAMDDVEDGVKYIINEGYADPGRIAIYGASHGGYATLMGLVKTPDLYACGVNYVGVSNIFTFFESFPEYWKPYKEMMKEIWYDLDNPEDAAIAKEVSPVYQLDKIKKPLFVVQGANDPRVNIHESDQIVEALRNKGYDVPYMVKYNEGHGFSKEENSIELYKAMLGFFSKYLK